MKYSNKIVYLILAKRKNVINDIMKKNKIFKSTLLNIDSTYRNLYPKNICKSDSILLPTYPFNFTQDSNILSINYPNHMLQTGDTVIIQNVEGLSRTLINSFYLINNFRYFIVDFRNTNHSFTLK